MTTQIATEVVDRRWLSARGNLHDARVDGASLREGILLIAINDEWRNFQGLDEYKGPSPGTLNLKGVLEHPSINQQALTEMIMDTTVTSDGLAIILSVSTFGHERAIFAKGMELVWQRKGGASL